MRYGVTYRLAEELRVIKHEFLGGNNALKRGFFMEIESLENLVARQFELLDRLISDSQNEDTPTTSTADFIPPLILFPDGCTSTEPNPL